MGFWNFLFDGKKPAADAPAAAAPAPQAAQQAQGTQIAYNPELVPRLQAEHRHLLELFGEIGRVFQSNDLATTAARLEQFRGAVLDHLMTENIRFYIYLEHSLKHDADSFELMHGFRHEMDGIGKAVLAFLSKYKDIAGQPNLAVSFGSDLKQVGEVLVGRIRREEETLYPLYMPAY
ncbi:MAG: hemerythrin domain-containing protein [Betaproteobacteria bacterium]|nr:hemerythrin domain-containing protein [Betaproteobacteria bacterium]